MRNNSDFDFVDFIQSYQFANDSIGFVGAESFILALIIGLIKQDVGWGIGTFIVILLLYGFPIIGGVFALAFSFVEAIIIYAIFINFTTAGWTWFISIIAFLGLVELHRTYGNVDSISLGYSLIIFDALMISGSIYFLYKTIPVSIIVFIILLIMAFIRYLRTLESVVLALGTTAFIYEIAAESLPKLNSIFVALFALLYTGVLYAYAHMGIDYRGMVQAKKKQKFLQEQNEAVQAIKNKIYSKYPELEKNYYYFQTEVCQTDWEKIQFDHDWYNYLNFLDVSSEKISFNQYFDKEKLYRTSHYNRDFARKNAENDFFKQQKQNNTSAGKEIIYFAGINNIEELKNRYHALLKIYHPDNQNGDVSVSQKIQAEYDYLLNKFNE